MTHAEELLRAEMEGRLIVLPVPIGAQVYMVTDKFGRVRVTSRKFEVRFLRRMGEDVFLTKEEAYEAAKKWVKNLKEND